MTIFCFHQQCERCKSLSMQLNLDSWKEKKSQSFTGIVIWLDYIILFGCCETRQVYNVWPALVPRAHYSSSPPSLACTCLLWTFWVIPSDERVPSFSFFYLLRLRADVEFVKCFAQESFNLFTKIEKGGGQYYQISDLLNSMIYWSRWFVDLRWMIKHWCYIHP